MIYSLNFSRTGNHIVLSSENGTIHCYKLPSKEQDSIENSEDSIEEEFDDSDLSIINDEVKEWRVCSVGSWIQTLFPINYDELMSSKKSDFSLTNDEFKTPNLCCMDKEEKNIIMYMKKGIFKKFTLDNGRMIENLDL